MRGHSSRRHLTHALAALGVVACALFAAAPGLAGTASVSGRTVTFTAGAGQTNTVHIHVIHGQLTPTRSTSGTPALRPSPGAGCYLDMPDKVRCSTTGGRVNQLNVTLGDGNDGFNVTFQNDGDPFVTLAFPTLIDGGTGNDTITPPRTQARTTSTPQPTRSTAARASTSSTASPGPT